MTEQYVASGMYWNYFYNVWKTVSSSPFSNAIVFVDDGPTITLSATTVTFNVSDKSVTEHGETILTLTPADTAGLAPSNYIFVQTAAATTAGIAVHKYGAIIYPADEETGVALSFTVDGATYNSAAVAPTVDVGDTVTFTKA